MGNPSKKRIAILVSFLSFFHYGNAAFYNYSLKDTAVNPPLNISSYNDTFYNSVLEAAIGIAQPYLLQQKYYTMTGVSVSGNSIAYNGVTYPISESYFNPGTGYYIDAASYPQYGINNFSAIWPTQCPNAFYDSSTKTFLSKVDCVGYGTRVLSVVGGTTGTSNAYLDLLDRLHVNNVTPFASKGYVASAYQFGVAFPTLKTAPKPGWEYVSGNICAASVIDGYNHVIKSTLGTYNGVRKGGFGLCQAGDIMAFAYDSSASSNGHWMVLETKPQLLDATSLQTYYPKTSSTKVKAFVAAHRVYAVPVIDDSGENAHFNDSRTSYSGIGHGTVLIVADTTDDAPVGFIFSPSTSIAYSSIDTSFCYAISVGRYITASQLPVSIASFTATEQNKTVVLNWATASELNTSHFNVQHSVDGKSFITIGNVNTTGKGGDCYKWLDYSPTIGNNYYRLQTVDKDGTMTYSKIIDANLSIINYQLLVYPNPAKNFVTIKGEHIAFAQVIDNLGRIVSSHLFKDASNPYISVIDLKGGVYHLRIQTVDGGSYSTMFIKE